MSILNCAAGVVPLRNSCHCCHASTHRGQTGRDMGLQVLHHLLQQRGSQTQLVPVHRGLEAAGHLLPSSRQVPSQERCHPPGLPHTAGVQAALGGHLPRRGRNKAESLRMTGSIRV